ncbi:MAG TPA: AAA family ATPase [Steroidobacteraceae bacterium]
MSLNMVSAGRCQFCHRTENEVGVIVAGDSGLICDGCIRSCAALLEPRDGGNDSKPQYTDRYAFQRLVRHFAGRAHEMQATSRSFPIRQQADLQRALDSLFGEPLVPENFVGINFSSRHEAVSYSKLLEHSRGSLEIAPPQFQEINIGRGETVRCLKNGLWLLREEEQPYAVVLSQFDNFGRDQEISLEVVGPPNDAGIALCTRVFEAIERRLSAQSCYRGRVLSLEQSYAWSGHAQRIQIHDLAPVEREDLILPEKTLEAIERNVLGFARQRAALRKLGLSTQKGLLFHGPPGTGKTHCIRYLSGQLSDHTTLLITAEQVGLLPEYMALARILQPALVVIEDADLIARERGTMNNAGEEVMLNRLLNELDGLRERADVFFVLTTNRPAMLEAALVSRPGRVDHAIEFPLPDKRLRQRLIALYACNLSLSQSLMQHLATRTEGASPAFIKELLRRIAQHHLEADSPPEISRATADAALHEMLFSGGMLNKRLLGGAAIEGEAIEVE